MNREVSAFLDSIRVIGSLLVVFGHMNLNWTPGIGAFAIPLGNEALAALFVVSGFVIGFVSDRREPTLRSYLLHRCARAYSLLIPCVLFGFALDSLGKHFMTTYYSVGSWPPLGSDPWEFLKALFSFTFLGEVWGLDIFPGSMAPYWTFPYEWTYYFLFASFWYLRGWWRVLCVLVICLIAGPQILMFFPLWLLGTSTYWLAKKIQLSVATGRAMFFTAIALAVLGNAIVYHFHLVFGFGVVQSPELWPFYLAAIVFSFGTLGFRFANIPISGRASWIQWAAGAAGTLYLLHFPLGRFLNGLIPFTWDPLLRWALLLVAIIAISLLFAQFAERRREAWRKKIEAGLEKAEQAAAFLQKKRRKKLSLL